METVLEREAWPWRWGCPVRCVLSPLACREEVKWGWTEEAGTVLTRKDKTRQVGRVI